VDGFIKYRRLKGSPYVMSVKQMSLPASGRDISIERPKILSSLGGGARRVEEEKKLKFQNTSTPSSEAVHPSRGEFKAT
jgi:hypothetical protein